MGGLNYYGCSALASLSLSLSQTITYNLSPASSGTNNTKHLNFFMGHVWPEVYCISVNSFVELLEFFFTLPDVKCFLSNRLSQNPLEKFFGQQRQHGRASENPNASDFIKNTQALRVIDGVCRNIRGNCRGSTSREVDKSMLEHLPKRRRTGTKWVLLFTNIL